MIDIQKSRTLENKSHRIRGKKFTEKRMVSELAHGKKTGKRGLFTKVWRNFAT